MWRRIRMLIGLEPGGISQKRLLNANRNIGGGDGGEAPPVAAAATPRSLTDFSPRPMLETVHEAAIYLHRFHNLDLFQQGWYQIKISMRWEDSQIERIGIPARVVQYEAPGLVSDDIVGVWRIDDMDHSFSTQPFRIKYARQDVLLSVMISFYMTLGKDEIPSTSAVILKFDLMYAPILENDAQTTLETSSAAIHEFRIPPKGLLGLHTYCPVHFDAFHAVLVDLSVHIVFLKAGSHTPSQKVTRGLLDGRVVSGEKYEEQQQVLKGSNLITLVKSLSTSHDILLEELQNISKGIGQAVEGLSDSDSNFDKKKLTLVTENSAIKLEGGQAVGEFLNGLKQSSGFVDPQSDATQQSLSNEELLYTFYLLGNQISFLWNTFLKFHRINRTKIMDYLHETWAGDRKTEWSIWMVHSKADIPHRYLKSRSDESYNLNVLGKVSLARKMSDDPAQTATTRAELHRRSIAQMNINNRSIQDTHIYGDPSHVPVVLLEHHVMDVSALSPSQNSSMDSLNQNGVSKIHLGQGDGISPRLFGLDLQKGSRILKIVIFVHGFQGHHLDLRLVRNQWLLIDPTAECLMSVANEDKTSGDFREMGSSLAEEVRNFLKKKMDKTSRLGGCKDIRLSFVGHSIGNVIIRSALADSVMEPFLKHLHTFMSLSGPHLGYWYSSNSLFNSGLWLLKKLKGAQCIHQLTFSDDPDLQNTFFYKLCQRKTLENFKNIILLSSPQDGYVPYHSARIELCPASSEDTSKKAQVFMEMLNNCLDQIRAPSSERRTFMRCDISFDMSSQGRNLNTIIGRAAHIEFLETDIFARFIMWSYPELFR